MPDEVTGRIFRFGAFEANEAIGELRKHGTRIKLHAQPFQLLLLLLNRHGDIVTRKEMQQHLWGNDTFVDFDHGLNAAMNKIREALNDSASQPRYIETVPGKGYKFIASVSEPAANSAATVSETWNLQSALLTSPEELPQASRRVVRSLLLLVQAMYLGFYFGALGNLQEIHDIMLDISRHRAGLLMAALVITAAILIPVRLFLATAVAFDFALLPDKFRKLFPVLLPLDLLWALSPFLLIHHINLGLALGMSAALIYLPFAQRSLVLMFGRNSPFALP